MGIKKIQDRSHTDVEVQALIGRIGTLTGLTSKPELNDSLASIEGYNKLTERFTVRLLTTEEGTQRTLLSLKKKHHRN